MGRALREDNPPPTVAVQPGAEPSPQELRGMTTVGQAFAWAPLREPSLSLVLDCLGMAAYDPPRVAANLHDEAVQAAVAALDGASPALCARVAVGIEACRKAVGWIKTAAQAQQEIQDEAMQKEAERQHELAVERIRADAAAAAAAASVTAAVGGSRGWLSDRGVAGTKH